MANLLNATRFKSPTTAVASFNVTIPATAAASKLVVVSGGNAIVTAKLGVGGTNFTKRTTSLGSQEIAAQDIVDVAGGTTTIQITLNGPENVDGYIYEFASGTLGNFIVGATCSPGSIGLNASRQVATSSITTTEPAVLFMMVGTLDNSSASVQQFWGMDPLGKQYSNEFIANDPTKGKYWSMIGLSDQPAAGGGAYQFVASKLSGGLSQLVIWAYQNLAPATPTYANPYTNAIAAENSLAGDYYSAWQGATTNANIAGYTDSLSYAPGDIVSFKVDSNNVGFTVDIYRHGWYGYISYGAKFKTTLNGTPAVQPAPTINGYGGTECAWSTTASWTIPTTATPGVYIYNMRRTDNSAYIAQGVFVVRSPVPNVRNNQIMVATADFTWQAYNLWGARADNGASNAGYTGRSLYGQGGSPILDKAQRAFAVSSNRPMGTISSNESSFYWDSECGLVNFLEGNGYDVAYFASVDLDVNPLIPSRFRIAASMGHSEYWTDNLRDAYENARDAGTHLAFLSSNTALWRVRFAAADAGRRTMICYKDSHDATGYDNLTKYDPLSYTGTWRDVRMTPGAINNTKYRPESGMSGQWFIGNGPFNDRIAVSNSFGNLPIWRNTAVASGSAISVRGTASSTITTTAITLNCNQPASTVVGDLIIAVVTTSGPPGSFKDNGLRLVRRMDQPGGHSTAMFAGYASQAGVVATNFGWDNLQTAAVVLTVYSGAVWQDTDAAIGLDTAGGASHITSSMPTIGADSWAVCAFADYTTGSTTKTTSWTAGAGLTARIMADTSAAASAPWISNALMDSNGAVGLGAHQYSATAQFANASASAGVMYISPGLSLLAGTIGTEWDYVKREEPTTPTNLVMLSEQALSLNMQQADYNGAGYSGNAIQKYGLSLYKATSGALVFSAGTWRYQWGISRHRGGTIDANGPVSVTMQQALVNILKDMGVAPTTMLTALQNGDPIALVDPGAAATAAAYGLTLTDPGYKNIFTASTEPTNNFTNIIDGPLTAYTLGTVFSSSGNGFAHGIRWFFPDYLPNGQVIGLLYSWNSDGTGTELARVGFSDTQSGWCQALFASPVSIAANAKYVAAIWTPDRYVSSNAQFAAGGVTNLTLTAPRDVAGTHNGKILASGVPTYPTGSTASNGYLADVLYIGSGVINFEGWGIPF